MATNSVAQLAEVLTVLILERQKAGTNTFGKIHLLAHSLGSRVLLGAMEQVGDRLAPEERIFGQVILAPPDIDAQDFVTVSSYAFAHRYVYYWGLWLFAENNQSVANVQINGRRMS